MSDTTVLAIPGSLRTSSINGALIETAMRLAPTGMTIETYTGLRDIPHYDADLDTEFPPDAVSDLRVRIAGADGLLIATPEYNGSIPGVLKNALDWASTPPRASVLGGKPTALMGATPGRSATAGAQAHLRQVLDRIGSVVVAEPEVMVSTAYERFDVQGRLVDPVVVDAVAGLLEALHSAIPDAERALAGV